jgi:hypothetical protein
MARFIDIGGARYLWRDILTMRREQRKAERQPQPTLFPLRHDARPKAARTAEGRYREPSLFEPEASSKGKLQRP